MSLVVLADGQRFEIESPSGVRDGVLRQRERKILPLTFRTTSETKIAKIKKAFSDPEKTEKITVYFSDEKESATDEQLNPTDGTEPSAHEVFNGFTITGERKEEPIVAVEGTPEAAPVYKMQFSLEMGQRQYGE